MVPLVFAGYQCRLYVLCRRLPGLSAVPSRRDSRPRARHIRNHPNLVRIVLAPLFCMGYFETTRRRLVSVYLLTIGIVVLVIMFHQLSQPWRGVLDAGVVFGLAWGVISLLWCSFTALGKADYPYSPELPV